MSDRKPFIIPLFLPHAGCPNRCVFCHQPSLTGFEQIPDPKTVQEKVARYLGYKGPQRGPAQLAFYGGNFLGLETDQIRAFVRQAGQLINEGKIAGIRFSTRPDTIMPDTLELLADIPVFAVELGVQSLDDGVLRRARRGHDADATRQALYLLKKQRIPVSAQIMLGLPGDTAETAMRTGAELAALRPEFVRIFPTVVVSDTTLAQWYRRGKYQPLSLEAAVSLCKQLFLLFQQHGIPVIRMGLQATTDLDKGASVVAGPYHPAFGFLVRSEVLLDRADALLRKQEKGRNAAILRVHPRQISEMRGMKNSNIHILRSRYSLNSLGVAPDADLSPGSVALSPLSGD